MQPAAPKTPDVVMYSTPSCGYCMLAKRLLAKAAIAYQEIDVSDDGERRAWLAQATGRRTVPQIFIRGQSIGGYDELAALEKSGRLAQMLA